MQTLVSISEMLHLELLLSPAIDSSFAKEDIINLVLEILSYLWTNCNNKYYLLEIRFSVLLIYVFIYFYMYINMQMNMATYDISTPL